MSEYEIRTITEARALSAMANPFRARILDALKVDGPSTVSALAARTGQAVGSASHHLKVLAEARLVVEAPELAGDRRERWWRLSSPGTQWSRADFADDPQAVSAALAAENLHLARQFERARAWLDNAEAAGEWDTAAFALQNWLHLSAPELKQLNQELLDVVTTWSARTVPDDGAQREPILVFARGFPAQP